MFFDPSAQAEARAAARAAVHDPHATTGLPGFVPGRGQHRAGVARGRHVLLQECIARVGARPVGPHRLDRPCLDRLLVPVECHQHDLARAGMGQPNFVRVAA